MIAFSILQYVLANAQASDHVLCGWDFFLDEGIGYFSPCHHIESGQPLIH
jgi:hypothetical protein